MLLDASQSFNFLPIPANIQFGFGVLSQLPEHIRTLGGTRVLIVTDPGLQAAGIIDRVKEILENAHVSYTVYDGVKPDSGSTLISEATGQLKEVGADLVVGIGGGSSLDTAKAVAAMATNPGGILDYVGLHKIRDAPLPIIAIPTTAGTGSEASIWAVFTDDRTKLKVAAGSVLLFPKVALCDPELTLGLPPPLTASTGMDALAHAIECYTNNVCQPISGSLALGAIELIGKHLSSAVLNGQNRQSRYAMLLASTMAGIAMNPTRLGLSHALAMPLGSWGLKIPHGVGNAFVLPIVMEFNCPAAPDRFAAVARALGEEIKNLSVREAAARSVTAVRALAKEIGLVGGLSEFGLKEDHIPLVVEEAMKSGNIPVNPRQTRAEDLEQILKKAL